MDSRGHWHDTAQQQTDDRIQELFSGKKTSHMPVRPVIEIRIGEMVHVVKSDGSAVSATFDAADKNRVTLTPQENGEPRPYLELAENVSLERSTGQSVRAQVWDNRKGKLILRTLPL